MAEPVVEQALRDFEVTANNFAMRLIRMAEVRVAYVQQIQQMSQSIRAAVQSGELSPEKGAQLANELRNQIMEMQRRRDFDLGRSLAASKKAQARLRGGNSKGNSQARSRREAICEPQRRAATAGTRGGDRSIGSLARGGDRRHSARALGGTGALASDVAGRWL